MTIEPQALISGLLDNSIDRDQLVQLLDALESSAELRDRVSTYQFVNDTTAGHRVLDNGYSKRIIERLQAEPGWQSRQPR
jgi:negative regulator of sigma E activity